ncbi:N-carboxy-L-threonyl-AMP--tRNA (adenosine37-6-N)-N-carboxy-L-threonyltransferase, TsaD subunit [Geotalea daltonii FRC-32]|uniref:tRNA N6-adenosine threonylcarbamoyltransferase n=1 Tax=Geotalea daltonii (strain DSM 22248 / JCM 15807 / FRC-32) TaxID=316067 RepID=TSAD_GEODF|nr:tRNA (adenosine(37)-N6)-threonylcarbamoyltransferase complex transferase subunit TsaD [Geotalea daltonii]B9M2S8.1 RecName: Full=tRNA N6-adenosine threonylcarbamoyltransferase; AltName: Full=N6-L-threonylcarbamoyladenine synthase; Short=t(6)A synthase; AltName: Full=t(6)A37 threonylcarbamoyladenosine biosynthesis protein TsaD; AltName: Full=tRNA threonylcarbamoyladenosine biosynthesis protein TsaD [Geotalea daltonii FRC-32]ACM21274.1 N-carboxy-L-threonyl-AMP--tRNA (adenosine37-6-N)-N-carboxy-L-
MLLLSIESSCDETAASVVRNGREILSNIVASQISIHADYGGVVPEIASRKHLETISIVIEEALRKADLPISAIEGIAVTRGPGLAGALLVGISTAKALAYGLNIPVVGVNHIESHILAIMLESDVKFPFIALAVSGGHTHLYEVQAIGRYRTIGQTLDDAAGEAFDKVAKLMGLPYPGGALIDRLAAEGDPRAIKFPRPLMHEDNYNFSFSGLKTAVLNYVRKNPAAMEGSALNDVCASFQAAVCEVLVSKTRAAVIQSGIKRLVVAGGVACNSGLRRDMATFAETEGAELFIPSPLLCSDNAAMLAVPGDYYLCNNIACGFELDALPVWPLDAISLTGGN